MRITGLPPNEPILITRPGTGEVLLDETTSKNGTLNVRADVAEHVLRRYDRAKPARRGE